MGVLPESRVTGPVYLGLDPRESDAYAVAVRSITRFDEYGRPDVFPITLPALREDCLYLRPTLRRGARLWDVRSDAPMATEHAISRFFTPLLAGYEGWAVSADCDILVRAPIARLFALADDRYAVLVVKHQHVPTETTKMDGQLQTTYARKNWSSVILWNCAHPANKHALTIDALNTWPGRDLHAFRWLPDEAIGTLPATWNYLVGVSPSAEDNPLLYGRSGPALVHFTLGVPNMPGYETCEFANEWHALLAEVQHR